MGPRRQISFQWSQESKDNVIWPTSRLKHSHNRCIMTEQEAIEKIEGLVKGDDPEQFHIEADEIIGKFLRSLGYGKLVDAWDEPEKWYS